MPTLMLRALPRDLVTRIKVYSRERNIDLPAGAAALLELGLATTAARAKGAAAVNGISKKALSDRGRAAAEARWANTKRDA